MEKLVLLLNSSEEIVNIVGWRRGVRLLFSGKAIPPYNHDEFYRLNTSKGFYDLPTALMLTEYVRIPHRAAQLSRKNLVKRDMGKCSYCGKEISGKDETIDHILPTSRGGKHTWLNTTICCVKCNTKKGDKTPEEAGMKLRKSPYVPSKKMLIQLSLERNKKSSWSRWII